MLYVTGEHALNLPCSLETAGDWHTPSLRWEKPAIRDSRDSIFLEWGIEHEITLPNGAVYKHANHLRAILDILETCDEYSIKWLQGFRKDFFSTDKYNELFFKQVCKLSANNNMPLIDKLMGYEFKGLWLDWKELRLCSN